VLWGTVMVILTGLRKVICWLGESIVVVTR